MTDPSDSAVENVLHSIHSSLVWVCVGEVPDDADGDCVVVVAHGVCSLLGPPPSLIRPPVLSHQEVVRYVRPAWEHTRTRMSMRGTYSVAAKRIYRHSLVAVPMAYHTGRFGCMFVLVCLCIFVCLFLLMEELFIELLITSTTYTIDTCYQVTWITQRD